MEIGQIVEKRIDETNAIQQLEIVRRHDLVNPIFKHVRGSTIFIEYDSAHLVGLVHYSKEGSPRNYYHMLVLLEKDTLLPVKMTAPFFFEKVGIEFCIGMAIKDDNYVFWISTFDRDAIMITVPKNGFVFLTI